MHTKYCRCKKSIYGLHFIKNDLLKFHLLTPKKLKKTYMTTSKILTFKKFLLLIKIQNSRYKKSFSLTYLKILLRYFQYNL